MLEIKRTFFAITRRCDALANYSSRATLRVGNGNFFFLIFFGKWSVLS